MLRRIAIVGLLGVAACFGDPPEVAGGSTAGATTAGECTPGTVLCPCRPGNACDPGLTCIPEGCVPDDCDPGMPMCGCLQPGDLCVDGWTCVEGLCHEGPSNTTAPTTTPSGSDTMTTASETTGGITDTGVLTSSSASASVSATATPTTGEDCNEFPCLGCLQCTLQNECSSEHGACQTEPSCLATLACFQMCLAMEPGMIQACASGCECGMPPNAFSALAECARTACELSGCDQELACGGGGAQ